MVLGFIYVWVKDLKGAAHTYSQLSNLVFGSLPATRDKFVPRQDTIIGTKEDSAFSIFIDDHAGMAKSFDAMFMFLHTNDQIFSMGGFWPSLFG